MTSKPNHNPNPWLTFVEACAEIAVSRSTMDDWRRSGRGPDFVRLPNGSLRIRRQCLEGWLAELEVA